MVKRAHRLAEISGQETEIREAQCPLQCSAWFEETKGMAEF